MIRCRWCVMPNTRPDTPFIDGICAACLTHGKEPQIDWATRGRELDALLERGKNGSGFDCIVPSSGGKDSHYQVKALLDRGARPLVVTASTCQLTEFGRKNIDNLARYATTIEVTPNRTVRAKLNRLALEQVGDISWPEHVSIFTTPFRVAADLGIPLIFYGENPQGHYGGPAGTDEARQLTRRWRSEFGGFLGLRPADLVGKMGITERDMADYLMPASEGFLHSTDAASMRTGTLEAHFLGQYLRWDSHDNADVARTMGMHWNLPSRANLWPFENLDNAQTGLHDYMMYLKYGYGRGCAQASVDVRYGRLKRREALSWVLRWDGTFPQRYAGVALETVLRHIEMTREELTSVLDRFTNWEYFRRGTDAPGAPPAPPVFLGAEGDPK